MDPEILRDKPKTQPKIIRMLPRISRYAGVSRIKRLMRGAPWVALLILIVFLVCGVFGSQIAPHSATRVNYEIARTPPFWQEGGSIKYPLGTDYLGRDMLSRLIVGSRVSLEVAFTVVVLAGATGLLIALLAGYLGGRVDMVLMRITDVFFCLPFLLIAIVVAAAIGASKTNLIIILAGLGWANYARILRGEVLRVKENDFVRLAIVAGASKARIMFRHIFPNIANTWVVLATLQLGFIIMAESSLSFLGVGVPPPTPAWGSMCAEGRMYLGSYWWISTFSGLAIFLIVISTNLMGDWLRFRLDPKFRQL